MLLKSILINFAVKPIRCEMKSIVVGIVCVCDANSSHWEREMGVET